MKNPSASGLSSSYLGNWLTTTTPPFGLGNAAALHLSAGPSLYGGGGLSPASGTAAVMSFNEQLRAGVGVRVFVRVYDMQQKQ